MRRGGYLARYAPLESRTPMPARTAPMARSAALERPWPLLSAGMAGNRETGKIAATRRSETGFSRAVKLRIRTRAGNGDPSQARCEATGVFLGEHRGEFQHIVARGMGGTSDPVKNTAANGCLLSPEAHRLAESRDPHMRAKGFWLPQGTDPRTVPMMLASKDGPVGLVWRAEDGLGPYGTGYLLQAPEAIAC